MKLLERLIGVLLLVLALSACDALRLPPGPANSNTSGVVTDGRTKGNPQAPLTLVVFSDFQ